MADDRYLLVRRYIYIYFRSPKVEANSCNLQMLKDNQRFLINFAMLLVLTNGFFADMNWAHG